MPLLRKLKTLLALAAALPLGAAAFRASAVKVDITPASSQWMNGYDPRQSTGVHDRIYHRIVAMDDGTTQFYLISSDLCLFSPIIYEEAAERVSRELNIPASHVWWSVTHTHSAPEVGPPDIYKALLGRSNHEWNREYSSQVINALVDGVKSAKARLQPATIGIGTGMSVANINRRAKDVDGSVTLGLNPEGPADRQIGLLRFERSDGSLIAIVANYAMHGTVLSGKNLLISGDAPGTVAAYVEEKTGAPMLYINGAAGNLAPIYSVYPDPVSGHLGQFRVLLGDRILAALHSIGPGTNQVTLSYGETIVETPRKAGLIWPEELARYSAKRNDGQPLVRLPVQFLRINDTLIWSAPIELFCEIGMAIRSQSPFAHTLYFGYTNGWLGYLPTKTAFREGGYEPKTSPFTEAAEGDLTAGVLAYLRQVPH
jgi:neutral ceramidase